MTRIKRGNYLYTICHLIKLALRETGPVGGFVISIFHLFGIIGVGVVAAGITIAEAVLG